MKAKKAPDRGGQTRAPLFEALQRYLSLEMVPFHTPGHKQGAGIDPQWIKLVGRAIFKMDLTVLPETDCLFHPTGAIRKAQELAARAYGADRSYFLVGGSTGGNLSMLMGVLFPGDKVIVPRHTHKSVIAGLIMTGALPVYVHPETAPDWDLILNVSPDSIQKAMVEHPGARAMFVSSPTYHGVCCDLEAIVRAGHLSDWVVMVDQAHGPHLRFHPGLPSSAMEAGADICVESSHKIISALTQAAMLHVQGPNIDVRDLESVLLLTQTTSPSYLLMASLDLARRQMATEGRRLLDRAINLAQDIRSAVNRTRGLYCLDAADVAPFRFDPTKLTVFVDGLGLTGYQASRILNRRYGVQAEMADWDHVAFIVSIADDKGSGERLISSLRGLAREHRKGGRKPKLRVQFPSKYPPMSMTPREAYFASYRTVPLRQAVGEIPTEFITVYPPGIPVVVPGERITAEAVEYVETMRRLGAIIVSPMARGSDHIRVVA